VSRKFLVVVLGGLLIGFSLYAFLGGFSRIRISLVTAEPMYLVGQYYEGPTQGEAFNEVFRQAGRLVEENLLQGQLGGIYYSNPYGAPDSIKAFIGVFVADTAVQLPAGYTLRQVPGGRRVLQAAVDAHYILAPDRLYPALFDFAEQQNIRLADEYIERFPDTRHAVLEVPVLEGPVEIF
jgi:hypothetical protein